jgi:hypothetical protein
MLPATTTIDPNSPSARAKLSSAPLTIAGVIIGRMTLVNVFQRDAPSVHAASSCSRSIAIKTGCTERMTNG